ncbi:MAG: acetoacetate decarboxylase family protein [Gammaproteobacteria bacterium]|nr:acetoacetate decarboxylase family protein [Gammaproteobacteria bacterium]
MAKNGRLTPDKWGPFGPPHNSLGHKGPWYYRDTEVVLVEFLTDEDYVLNIMPPELELYEPAMAFMVIETNHWTTIGPYSEVYNGILCTWKGELHAYVPGVYVTGEASQIIGREVYGFGKKRAHRIELIRHDTGEVEALMEVKPGDRALRALMNTQKNEPAEAVGTLPLIVLRIVPDAEGSDIPALAQLVSVTFSAKPLMGSDGKAEVFSGPGSLTFGCASDAELPVKQVVSCKYAHFNADLPYGKVLKTYTQKELEVITKARKG